MIKLFQIIIFLFFFLPNSFADQSIAYINIDSVISKSISGKNLLKKLNEFEKTEIKKLTNRRELLSQKKDSLMTQKNIISEKEFKNQFQQLQKELNEFKSDESKIIKDLTTKKNKSILKYLNFINPLIQDYMDKNSISILIEKKNIFIARSKYDITDNLIKIIDQNLKEFNIEK